MGDDTHKHTHMESGVAVVATRQAIHIIGIRKGRTFTSAEIYRHRQALKAWVWRYWASRGTTESTSMPDLDSMRVTHTQSRDQNDTLTVGYTLWEGWADDARCMAAKVAMGGASNDPDMSTIIASLLAQSAGDQYDTGERDGLPN